MEDLEKIIEEAIEGYKHTRKTDPSFIILNGATYEKMRIGTKKWKVEEMSGLLTYIGVPIALVLSKKNNTYVRIV
jgi:hypothetical protein